MVVVGGCEQGRYTTAVGPRDHQMIVGSRRPNGKPNDAQAAHVVVNEPTDSPIMRRSGGCTGTPMFTTVAACQCRRVAVGSVLRVSTDRRDAAVYCNCCQDAAGNS
jgi:hypothetical protein